MRYSVLQLLGLPDPFGAFLVIFGFILVLSPYLSGLNFGVFHVPTVNPNRRRVLQVLGPLGFVVAVLLSTPIVSRRPTFAIYGMRSLELVQLLTQRTGMQEAQNATYVLQLAYSGELEPVGPGLWWYPGGTVRILINGQECQLAEALRINRTPPQGNTKGFVEESVEGALQDSVAEHTQEIVTGVIKCLPSS